MQQDTRPATDQTLRDRYYQGTILRVHPGTGTGWLRTSRGREVPFTAAYLQLLGTSDGFSALQPGLQVGFDLGRTSRGLCVTTIRIYDSA